MSSAARTDGAGDDVDERGDLWARVGREAVGNQLNGARHDVEAVMHDIAVETLFAADDPSPEQVRKARQALNEARWILEEFVAPAAGVESWGDPPMRVPMGVLWDLTNHPKADGVDPREYVEEEPNE